MNGKHLVGMTTQHCQRASIGVFWLVGEQKEHQGKHLPVDEAMDAVHLQVGDPRPCLDIIFCLDPFSNCQVCPIVLFCRDSEKRTLSTDGAVGTSLIHMQFLFFKRVRSQNSVRGRTVQARTCYSLVLPLYLRIGQKKKVAWKFFAGATVLFSRYQEQNNGVSASRDYTRSFIAR